MTQCCEIVDELGSMSLVDTLPSMSVLDVIESRDVVERAPRLDVLDELGGMSFVDTQCRMSDPVSELQDDFGAGLYGHYRSSLARIDSLGKAYRLFDLGRHRNHLPSTSGVRPTPVNDIAPNGAAIRPLEFNAASSDRMELLAANGFVAGSIACSFLLCKFTATTDQNVYVIGASGVATLNQLRKFAAGADMNANMYATTGNPEQTSGSSPYATDSYYAYASCGALGGRIQLRRDGVVLEQSTVIQTVLGLPATATPVSMRLGMPTSMRVLEWVICEPLTLAGADAFTVIQPMWRRLYGAG